MFLRISTSFTAACRCSDLLENVFFFLGTESPRGRTRRVENEAIILRNLSQAQSRTLFSSQAQIPPEVAGAALLMPRVGAWARRLFYCQDSKVSESLVAVRRRV